MLGTPDHAVHFSTMIKDHRAVTLGPLTRADGSASFSSHGYSVIGAVNGPVEVQRRDELPEEAAVDVAVRPATGVGGRHFSSTRITKATTEKHLGVRERHLESIVQSTLRHVILVSAHPRTLIQVTLQVVEDQGDEFASCGLPQSASVSSTFRRVEMNANEVIQNLPILPALLQTATLALLTSSIPLSTTLTSTLIVVDADGGITPDPQPAQVRIASSIHVLAFSTLGQLLVVESEGDFTLGTWQRVHARAEQVCRGRMDAEDVGEGEQDEDENVDMEIKPKIGSSEEDRLRITIQEQVRKDQRWRLSSA